VSAVLGFFVGSLWWMLDLLSLIFVFTAKVGPARPAGAKTYNIEIKLLHFAGKNSNEIHDLGHITFGAILESTKRLQQTIPVPVGRNSLSLRSVKFG
jgi:hypothetical protein